MNHHRYKKEKEFLPIIPGSSEIVSMAGDDKKIYYPVRHSGDDAGVILLVFLSMFSTHFLLQDEDFRTFDDVFVFRNGGETTGQGICPQTVVKRSRWLWNWFSNHFFLNKKSKQSVWQNGLRSFFSLKHPCFYKQGKGVFPSLKRLVCRGTECRCSRIDWEAFIFPAYFR